MKLLQYIHPDGRKKNLNPAVVENLQTIEYKEKLYANGGWRKVGVKMSAEIEKIVNSTVPAAKKPIKRKTVKSK
jgi:hypothetical protein